LTNHKNYLLLVRYKGEVEPLPRSLFPTGYSIANSKPEYHNTVSTNVLLHNSIAM